MRRIGAREPVRPLGHMAALCLVAWIGAEAGAGHPAIADDAEPEKATTEQKLDDVDQRLRIIERQKELDKEKEADKAKETAQAGAGKDGFYVRSADGSFQLRIRGYVQFDGRFFKDDTEHDQTDTFILRRVRPIFEGTVFKFFDFRLMPDFGAGQTVLQDAYMDARISGAFKIRAGKYKVPFGLERLQSATDILFVERALPTNLVPNRDLGVQLFGEPLDGVFTYAVGVFNGVSDGGSADTDINDSKEMAARLFVQPFKKTRIASLQGLGIGVAGTRGSSLGTLTATGVASYKTAGQQTFFAYRSATTLDGTVVADGRRVRFSPQLWYYAGRLGVQAEYVTSRQKVALGTAGEDLEHKAWQATASFLLTNDKASPRGFSPKKPMGAGGPPLRGPGAFEIAARYGRLSIDKKAFPIFANPLTSARTATEVAAGVNWYLNKNVRVMVDGSKTTFEGGEASGEDREDEKVLLSRFQISF